MPPLDDIDWGGIRAASTAVGVREAARQAARHLPAEEQHRFVMRCLKRSEREGWMIHYRAAKDAVVPRNVMPLSSPVITGSEIVAITLEERQQRTKLGLSSYVTRMAEQSDKYSLQDAQRVKDVADIAAKVWPEASAPTVLVNVLSMGADQV